jgi:hypothetical protein
MEELLCNGFLYRFTILSNREFTGRFDKIASPNQTLFVTEYTDENGCVPGTRTLPFEWVNKIELIEEDKNEIESISIDMVPVKKKRKQTKPPKMVNNFMDLQK